MERMPFYYRMIRGAIGRKFVVKHYEGGRVVVTRFPDMSGIVATEKQRVRRDLFREAVVWAKWIIGDEGRKLAFRNTLPRKTAAAATFFCGSTRGRASNASRLHSRSVRRSGSYLA